MEFALRARDRSPFWRIAEQTVQAYVLARGHRILGANVRVGRLEIDLLTQLGDVVIVIEVRTRSPESWCSGFGSIDPKKRATLRRAGQRLWQMRFRDNPGVSRMRFDAASVVFTPEGPEVFYAVAAF